MTHKFLTVLTCLMLMGCNEKTETQSLDISGPAIELPVTAQVKLPEKGVAYAFVPNDAAQWLSQIIILSEDGDLYQATADTHEARPIDGPKAKAIVGLDRPGAAGMFLAINKDNTVQAYIESSDEGDFTMLNENSSDINIIELCGSSPAISCDQNSTGEISVTETQKNSSLATDMGPLSLKVDQGRIIVSRPNASSKYTPVVITNGITIPGVPKPQSVHAVSDNFGGPFNNGLVLVSDADEPRFALISADFARKTLGDQTSE